MATNGIKGNLQVTPKLRVAIEALSVEKVGQQGFSAEEKKRILDGRVTLADVEVAARVSIAVQRGGKSSADIVTAATSVAEAMYDAVGDVGDPKRAVSGLELSRDHTENVENLLNALGNKQTLFTAEEIATMRAGMSSGRTNASVTALVNKLLAFEDTFPVRHPLREPIYQVRISLETINKTRMTEQQRNIEDLIYTTKQLFGLETAKPRRPNGWFGR